MTSVPLKETGSLLVFSFHLQLKLPCVSLVSLFWLGTKVQLLWYLTLQLLLQRSTTSKNIFLPQVYLLFSLCCSSHPQISRFSFGFTLAHSASTLSAVLPFSFISHVNPSSNHLLHPLGSSRLLSPPL